MPFSFTEKADPKKGELWITLDQLDKREISISSLCSKNMYKSVFKVNRNLKLIDFDEKYSKAELTYKVDIKEMSTFMINLLSFTNKMEGIGFGVFTDNNNQQKVETKNEILPLLAGNPTQMKGEANSTFYQKFKLQPNKYIFYFIIGLKKTSAVKVDLLLKIGSTSECTFKEIKNEDRTRSKRVKDHICSYSTSKNFLFIFIFVSLVYFLLLVTFFT